MDLDSTICEVHGKLKQGAAYGYTRGLGYHPLIATWAKTARCLRRLARILPAPAILRLVAGAPSGQAARSSCGPTPGSSTWLIDTLVRLGVAYSITVTINDPRSGCIDAIDESAWRTIDYPDAGEPSRDDLRSGGGTQARRREPVSWCGALDCRYTPAAMWPEWRTTRFVTNVIPMLEIDLFHRAHAGIELAIRDLKSFGLGPAPRATSSPTAWLSCAVLAHNLIRWSAKLGDVHPDDELTVARQRARPVFALPGRLVNSRGSLVLRLPEQWPWATTFTAPRAGRALPLLT